MPVALTTTPADSSEIMTSDKKHTEEVDKKAKKTEEKHNEDKSEKKDKKHDKKEKKEKKDKKDKKEKKEKKDKKDKKDKKEKEEEEHEKSNKRKADEIEDDAEEETNEAKKVKVGSLSTAEWRKMHKMQVPPGTPDPYQTFDQLTVPAFVSSGLQRLQYASPTPIQAQTWPIALSSQDMVGIAETGSGKTMAYLLPGIVRMHKLINESKVTGRKPAILVLAPTRELAQQIHEVAIKFLAGTKTGIACVYGGEAKGFQIRQLKAGASIVIATPGRLTDLYQMGFVDFSEIFYVVLDEADRMLDMGFEPQIRQILDLCPQEGRQTVMFTATFPKEISALAYSFQQNPVLLKIGSEDLTTNKNITQKIYMVEPFEKYGKLKEILQEVFVDNCRILIFANTKKACDAMAQRLWDEGLAVNAIHGDLDQGQRNRAMQQFKDGTLPVLFATDVAARGLDIKGVKHVINADFPTGFENYVHRIGRTGRGGEQGIAHSLVCLDSDVGLSNLVEFLDQCGQTVPTTLRDKYGRKSRGAFGSRGGLGRGGFGGRGGRGRGGRGGSRGGRGRGGFGGEPRSRFDSGGRGGRGGSRGGSFGASRGGGTEFFA